jgi:large subunit ribosomal protein L25
MAVKIKMSVRTVSGKGVCRKLRAQGIVPAVFYGPEYKESVVGSVSLKDVAKVANTGNWETNMIDLELPDGRTEMALLREVQRHAVTSKILHVDLYQLVAGRKVKVTVPIRIANRETSVGIKMGGMFEQPIREVEMLVLPREIPSEIVVDAANMAMGDEFFVRDLPLPASAELEVGGDDVVVMVTHPKAIVVEAPAEEAAEETPAAEVEVVGKGKKKDEDEEAEEK